MRSIDPASTVMMLPVMPRDIAREADDLVAEFAAQLFGPGRDTLHDPDAGAFGDKARNDGTADPGTAAGYQRHLPVEPAHEPIPLTGAHHAALDARRLRHERLPE